METVSFQQEGLYLLPFVSADLSSYLLLQLAEVTFCDTLIEWRPTIQSQFFISLFKSPALYTIEWTQSSELTFHSCHS